MPEDRPDTTDVAIWARWLRWRVAALRASTRCRQFPATLEIVPVEHDAGAAAPVRWTLPGEPLDHALRVEVLARLLRPGQPLAVVAVRPGDPEPDDADYAWLAAACTATEVTGADVDAVVALSRWGWSDLLSGAHRRWRRLRAA